MNDRTKASAFIFGLAGVLAIVLGIAYATSAAAGVWHQSYGRDSATVVCDEGWYPSWAYWPNDGTGGWVCNREVDDPSVPVTASSGGGSTPVSGLPTDWVSISGGTIYIAVGDSVLMGVAPPCVAGTMEIRATAPLVPTLSGPEPQTLTVTNPSFVGAVDFFGSYSVDTRCV